MRTESISRRLAVLEPKVKPKISLHEQRLLENERFARVLDSHGVSAEAFRRNGLGVLPRDLLRALVERLRIAAAVG